MICTRIAMLAAAAALVPMLSSAPSQARRVPDGTGASTVFGTVANAPGATVTVLAWPRPEATTGLPNGDAVTTTRIASGTADGTGRFALSPAYSALPAASRSPHGAFLEVDLDSADGDRLWFGDADQLPAGGLSSADFTAASSSDPQSQHGKCSTWEGWWAYGWDLNQHEKFIVAYGRPHAQVSVSLHVGSDHSMQTAANTSNGAGWVASASSTIETHNDAGATQPFSYPTYLWNSVNYHKYWRRCTDGNGSPGDNPHIWNEYLARPEQFADFYTQTAPAADPAFGYCYLHDAGYQLYKTEGRNETFDYGVSLPEIAHLDVHASYSSDTTATWGPLTGQVHLCGNSSHGLLVSDLVAARYIPPSPNCIPGHPCDARR